MELQNPLLTYYEHTFSLLIEVTEFAFKDECRVVLQ